jgi:cobalt transport protein
MRMSKNTPYYIAGFAIIAALVICTLAFASGEFGGSDDAGGEEAEKWGFEPWTGNWMENLNFELPGETESFLFAVQAAIGAIIIGFFIGQNYGKKKALAGSSEPSEE